MCWGYKRGGGLVKKNRICTRLVGRGGGVGLIRGGIQKLNYQSRVGGGGVDISKTELPDGVGLLKTELPDQGGGLIRGGISKTELPDGGGRGA